MESVFSLTLLLFFLKYDCGVSMFWFPFLLCLPPPSLSAQGGYSAPSFSPWQGSFQGIPRTVPPHRRQSESVSLTPTLLCFPFTCPLSAWPSLPSTSSLSRVICRHVLNQHSLGSPLLINISYICMWTDFST